MWAGGSPRPPTSTSALYGKREHDARTELNGRREKERLNRAVRNIYEGEEGVVHPGDYDAGDDQLVQRYGPLALGEVIDRLGRVDERAFALTREPEIFAPGLRRLRGFLQVEVDHDPSDGGEGSGDGAGKEVRVLFQQLEAPEDGRELFGGV